MTKRCGLIRAVGYLAMAITGLLAAVLVIMALLSLPDIRRYLRIGSM